MPPASFESPIPSSEPPQTADGPDTGFGSVLLIRIIDDDDDDKDKNNFNCNIFFIQCPLRTSWSSLLGMAEV